MKMTVPSGRICLVTHNPTSVEPATMVAFGSSASTSASAPVVPGMTSFSPSVSMRIVSPDRSVHRRARISVRFRSSGSKIEEGRVALTCSAARMMGS